MEYDNTIHITLHLSEDTKNFLAGLAVAGNHRLIDAGLTHYKSELTSVEQVIARVGYDIAKEITANVLR